LVSHTSRAIFAAPNLFSASPRAGRSGSRREGSSPRHLVASCLEASRAAYRGTAVTDRLRETSVGQVPDACTAADCRSPRATAGEWRSPRFFSFTAGVSAARDEDRGRVTHRRTARRVRHRQRWTSPRGRWLRCRRRRAQLHPRFARAPSVGDGTATVGPDHVCGFATIVVQSRWEPRGRTVASAGAWCCAWPRSSCRAVSRFGASIVTRPAVCSSGWALRVHGAMYIDPHLADQGQAGHDVRAPVRALGQAALSSLRRASGRCGEGASRRS